MAGKKLGLGRIDPELQTKKLGSARIVVLKAWISWAWDTPMSVKA